MQHSVMHFSAFKLLPRGRECIFSIASIHSDMMSNASGGKTLVLLLYATGFVDLRWVFENGLDKLTKQTLHVALATRKQALQEGDVSTMRRQQQSNIRQVLDYSQWKSCEGREKKNLSLESIAKQKCPGYKNLKKCIQIHMKHR